jgi:hypothetical protein
VNIVAENVCGAIIISSALLLVGIAIGMILWAIEIKIDTTFDPSTTVGGFLSRRRFSVIQISDSEVVIRLLLAVSSFLIGILLIFLIAEWLWGKGFGIVKPRSVLIYKNRPCGWKELPMLCSLLFHSLLSLKDRYGYFSQVRYLNHYLILA